MTMEYYNLSRGVFCPMAEHGLLHFTYIQSTHCEQKRWNDVVLYSGTQFLLDVASGAEVRVHDVSERNRLTRATWQGLEFIRLAVSLAWELDYDGITGRGGKVMENYFRDHYRESESEPYHRFLASLKKYVSTDKANITVHDCKGLI